MTGLKSPSMLFLSGKVLTTMVDSSLSPPMELRREASFPFEAVSAAARVGGYSVALTVVYLPDFSATLGAFLP